MSHLVDAHCHRQDQHVVLPGVDRHTVAIAQAEPLLRYFRHLIAAFDLASPALQSGKSYQIQAKSYDSAGNEKSVPAVCSFTFDNTEPDSNVVYPDDNRFLNTLAKITGTANDLTTSITKVEVSVRRISDGYYWDGAVWNAGPDVTYITDTANYAAGVWELSSGLGFTEDNKEYQIQCRATDEANNVETAIGAGRKITWDTTPPVTDLKMPVTAQLYKMMPTISGTAVDAKHICLRIG